MDELYVEARRVLLDGLTALGEHREALILVGAQAIYLRVGESDLAVAPYTTDGDLAIDPRRLADIPPLEKALMDAGFLPKSDQSVGIWVAKRVVANKDVDVALDLLVPAAASRNAGKSRAAELAGHGKKAARNVEGLDAALVDNDKLIVKSLDPVDERSLELTVAGPAALLISKVRKIADRISTNRLSDKDALDVLRLLRGTETAEVATRWRKVLADPLCGEAGRQGLDLLKQQFIAPAGIGGEMIERAVGGLADVSELKMSARILSEDLLKVL